MTNKEALKYLRKQDWSEPKPFTVSLTTEMLAALALWMLIAFILWAIL